MLDAKVELGCYMYIPSPGRGDGGGGCVEGGYLHLPTSEQRHKIYRNKAHYGPVSGGGAAPRISGFELVVVIGGNLSRGDT